MTTDLSPARLPVMWNRLLAVVEEQGQALIRAAFSPIVRESGDISAGIFDLRGRMLAQAVTGTPGHINTMAEAVKTAEQIAGMSRPVAMMVKDAVNQAYETTLATGVHFERRLFHSTFATEDQKEGMAAFAEKRTPKFKHR